MSKKSLSVILFMFFVLLSLLSYLSFSLFCQNSINTAKTQLIATDKLLNNQFNEIAQTNTEKSTYLINNYSFVSMLNELEMAYKSKNIDKYQSHITNINTFLSGQLSDDVNFISFYSPSGDMLAGVNKVNVESPAASLGTFISQSISGKKFNLMVQHNKQLYSVNIQPVSLNNKIFGSIMLGKEISNSVLSNIPDVYNTQTIILTKNQIITSNLNALDARNIFNLYKTDSPIVNKNIDKSIPGVKQLIEIKKINHKNFWITGSSIIKNNSAYFLLKDCPWWVSSYLFLNSHIIYVLIFGLISLIILSALTSMAIDYSCKKVNNCTLKSIEKAKSINNSINNQIDSFIDRLLASVLAFSNSGIFRNNNELMDFSNSVTNMVKQYKSRVHLEKETSDDNMTNPVLRNETFVVNKNATLYFSNIRNFIKLVEVDNPEFGFRILNIYLKLQHEIIPKYNGKIIKVSDDRVVASFESRNTAESALKAAIEIQQNISTLNQLNPENVELSISIVTGDLLTASVLEQLYYTGTLLKIGNTLVNKTPSGWIYLDQNSYDLRGLKELTSEEDFISIKGIKEHISFYKVSPDMINTINTFPDFKDLNVIAN